MKKLLVIVAGLALIATLAFIFRNGSSSDDKPNPTSSAQISAPTMINPELDSFAQVNVGNSVVLTVENPEVWTVQIANPALLEFIPGGNQGSFETNPSLTALAVGQTTVIASDNTGRQFTITISVLEADGQLLEPSATAQELVNLVVGKTEADAISLIEKADGSFTFRVVKRDGESFPVTMDYSISRINFEIENGIVVAASIG